MMKIIVYGLFGLLLVILFSTQVIRSDDFRRISEHNRIRLLPLPAPRGEIVDRNGFVLARNRPAYQANVIPEDFNPKDLPKLTRILGMSKAEIQSRLSAPRMRSMMPVVLKRDISREAAMQIAERRPLLSGIFVQSEGVRYYPYGALSAHVIGYVGKISEAEYKRFDHQVYRMDSMIGRGGLERVFDQPLRGEDGGQQIEVDAYGRQIKVLSEKQPIPGKRLELSLDVKLEEEIAPLLKDKYAAVAMMNLQTGELIVSLSAPSFDPNLFVSRGKSKERMALLKDKRRPLVNRLAEGVYPPGSVFKLLTAIAGLETGKITPHTTFYCGGYFRLSPRSRPFPCWNKEGHGNLDMTSGLERSCNIYFYHVGRLVGVGNLAKYARLLGFGRPVPIEIPAAAGLVPDVSWKRKRFHQPWYGGETLNFSIGQGFLQVTPLQMLQLTSVIANNGYMVKPTLLKKDPSANVTKVKLPIRPAHLKAIRQGMLKVVSSPYGTGQLGRVAFMKIAGKTGSAQAPPGKSHAWFTGFFPYEKPRIAFVAFVEHGGSGGIAAAGIVKQMVGMWRNQYALYENFIKPTLPPVTL